jgi:hypothetical protein
MNRRQFNQSLAGGLLIAPFSASSGFQIGATENTIDPKDLKSIGGNWFLKEGQKPLYYYKDADRYLDLFSYHTKDSNKDGIDNLKVSHDDKFLIVNSQGYPNHATAIFPNSRNPNSIEVQDFHFKFPLTPRLAPEITRLPMGPIGMALNGVVFFNPFEMEGMNAVEGYSEVWLDACCGHPQQTGVYHYHKYPSCVKSPFIDNGKQHSPVLGFAFDGFPLYGPYESSNQMARDIKEEKALDVCNGHKDDTRGYHYHVTPGRFPYILGGYAGVVEPSNNRGLRFARKGPIEDNTQPGSRETPVITSVSPGNVSRGKSHVIRFELEPENIRRGPALPEEKPDWVQIGPFVAKKIEREKNVVLATFDIPASATQGVFYDCHIEFGREAYPISIKRNDALRVVE